MSLGALKPRLSTIEECTDYDDGERSILCWRLKASDDGRLRERVRKLSHGERDVRRCFCDNLQSKEMKIQVIIRTDKGGVIARLGREGRSSAMIGLRSGICRIGCRRR